MVIDLKFIGLNNLKLCLFTIDNIDYFGCDCKTCYFMCIEGYTFKNVVVGGLKWLDMERSCE